MKLNLDTIRSLDTSKSYYLSNTTGEIKAADTWQKFKCFFGFGDGREKAAKLVAAVKNALLESSDKISDANLSAGVQNLENTRSRFFAVSGRAIAQLAANFSAANEADIARTKAAQVAKDQLSAAVKDVRSLLRLETGRLDDVMEVLKRAAKPLIDNPPMKTDAAGRRVLDADAFKAELAKVLDDAERMIVDVSKAGPNGRARFDAALRDAMFEKLEGTDEQGNKKDVSALGSIADIRFKKVLANCSSFRPSNVSQEVFDAHVRILIDACGEDPDMLDAIEDTARRFLVRGDDKMRKPEEIAKRVAASRANQKELFDAVGGDRTLMPAARKLAGAFAGLPLPAGIFTKAMEVVKKVDVSALQGLSEASDSLELHNAIEAFNQAVREVLSKSGAMEILDGEDETTPFRQFVVSALLARLPKSDLRGIATALASPMAAKLNQFYDDCSTGTIKVPKNNLPKGVNAEASIQFMTLFGYMNEIKEFAEKMLGREAFVPIRQEDAAQLPKDAIFAGDILDSILTDSAEFVAEKRERFLNGVIKGQGEEATIVRKLFADMIGPAPQNPAAEAFGRLNAKTRRMLNATIMGNAKQVMLGQLKNTQLFKDIERGMEVTLEGVGKLSKDFPTALDQIACFVTGRKDATFETLDDNARKKAAIVIGFLGQDSEKAVVDGCSFALDPKGDATAFGLGGDQSRDKKIYQLEFVNGQLNVSLKLDYQRTGFLYKGDLTEPKGGITLTGGFGYSIPEAEMNRLLELDLGAYDDTEAMAEFNGGDEKGFQEKRVEKMFNKLPEPYRIDAQCKTNYEVELRG